MSPLMGFIWALVTLLVPPTSAASQHQCALPATLQRHYMKCDKALRHLLSTLWMFAERKCLRTVFRIILVRFYALGLPMTAGGATKARWHGILMSSRCSQLCCSDQSNLWTLQQKGQRLSGIPLCVAHSRALFLVPGCSGELGFGTCEHL